MRFSLLCIAVLLAASCGSTQPPPCGPSNCATCCTGDGQCVLAVSAAACGASGLQCVECPAEQQCISGFCTVVQAPEDAGQPDAGNADAGSSQKKRVFVTSASYDGNLLAAGGGASGLDGADRLCQSAAAGALLGGIWRAFVSDSSTDAIDRISDVGPWYLAGTDGGTKIFNNRANLASTPLSAINRDENGGTVNSFSNVEVWTGTNAGGRAASAHCNGWTSALGSQSGMAGDFDTLGAWTQSSSVDCDFTLRLYCIEQ